MEGGLGGEVKGRLLDARGHARDGVGVGAGVVVVARGVEAGAVVAGLGGGRVVDAVEDRDVGVGEMREGGGDEGVKGGFGGDVGVGQGDALVCVGLECVSVTRGILRRGGVRIRERVVVPRSRGACR